MIDRFKVFKRLKKYLSKRDRFTVIVHNRETKDRFIQFALEDLADRYEYDSISIETDLHIYGDNNYSYSFIKINGVIKWTIKEDIINTDDDDDSVLSLKTSIINLINESR